MPKMIINLKSGTSISDFKNDDILLYDNDKGQFYRTTSTSFFNKYELKLTQLKETYDSKISKIMADNAEFQANVKEILEQLRAENSEFKKTIQENQATMINMVEALVKGEN